MVPRPVLTWAYLCFRLPTAILVDMPVCEERHPVASGKLALLIQGEDQPGVLYQLTRVIASHQANITTIDIIGKLLGSASVYLELQDVADSALLVNDLQALPVVKSIEPMDT